MTLKEIVPTVNINYGYMEHMRSERARSGVVHLDFAIGYGTSSLFVDEVRACLEQGVKEISVLLNSPGGAVYESMIFHDILASLPKYGAKSTAYVLGVAASAAAMIILQGAQRRVAAPNAEFMVHEISLSQDPFSEIRTSTQEDVSKFQNRLQDKMLGVLAARSGKTVAFWTKLIARKETWLDSKKAKEYGLIDEIGTFPLK